MMDDIPSLVLQKLLACVPLKDRPSCREVCHRWLTEIETSPFVGLSIKIDSEEPVLLDFLKKVVVKEVSLCTLVLKNNQDLWMNLRLEDCRTVILSGYTSSMFINENLLRDQNWNHLSRLYFCGTFLISQEVSSQNPSKCILPSLKELRFILPNWTIYEATKSLGERKKMDIRLSYNEEQIGKLLCEPTRRNIGYLFSIIRSPYLKALHLILDLSQFWNMEPLYEFIENQNQGSKLEELIVLTTNSENSPNPYSAAKRRFNPVQKLKLTKLQSLFLKFIHPSQLFWMDLVKAQDQLELLFMNFLTFPKIGFQNFLTGIAIQNYETLRCMYIIGNGSGQRSMGLEFDLQSLNILHRLEVLVISTKGRTRVPYPVESINYDSPVYPHNFHIKNIHYLPTSLKVFKSSFIPSVDFDGVHFLKQYLNLEELKLPCLTRTGFLEEGGQVTDFVEAALRHRRLNIFKIKFTFNEPNAPDISLPWIKFRSFEYRQTGFPVPFPLGYDRLQEILKGRALIEKVILGGRRSRTYFRNLFEALHYDAIWGKIYERPFCKDPNTDFYKLDKNTCDLSSPRLSEEPSSPGEFHNVYNFNMSNLDSSSRIELTSVMAREIWLELRRFPQGASTASATIEDEPFEAENLNPYILNLAQQQELQGGSTDLPGFLLRVNEGRFNPNTWNAELDEDS